MIWEERRDLRETFDLSRRRGREGLLAWYLRHGFVELGLGEDESDQSCVQFMAEALPAATILSFLPLTRLMYFVLDQSAVENAFHDAPAQEKMLSAFFAQGLTNANLASFLTHLQAAELLSPDQQSAGQPRLLRCIWSSSPDLHERFAGPEDQNFHNWCLSNEAVRRFPILAHPLIKFAERPKRRRLRDRPFGVNLFGHAYARSGISEDMRMACRVLKTVDIPYAVRNVTPGTEMPEEDSASSRDNEQLPFAINMFCMPAASTVTAVLQAGRELVADHYNIGFWPWELPEMPDFWRHAYDLVDELWASTGFTRAAFARSSPHPVRHIPFAVEANDSDGLGRAHFDLPAEVFLFGFAFDGLSGFARKAPLATVRAFQQAFREDDRSVGLVIKGIRVEDNPAWREIVDAVKNDNRIHFVTTSLSRASLLDLYRALDCFVSLHRSEGFGRNIAEAMVLGKPVIVTAHSGNMDFTDQTTAALVSCSLRAVAQGEYPFGTGQLWAEPNVAVAAAQMQRMVSDKIWREKIAVAGQARIANAYSPNVVGKLWHDRLTEVYAD